MLGQTKGRVPRLAMVYADFAAEQACLHEMRVRAMTAFASDVHTGTYPAPHYTVASDPEVVAQFRDWLHAQV